MFLALCALSTMLYLISSHARLDTQQEHVLFETQRPKRTYVMNYLYGQQGAGVRSIASLQCFLSSLKSSYLLAEPYIENSRIQGTTSTKDVLKFGDIFDMDLFNAVSRERGRVEMVPIEEIMRHRPNLSILIDVSMKSKASVLHTSTQDSANVNCIEDKAIEDMFQSQWQKHKQKMIKSCFVRVVRLPRGEEIGGARELENYIFGGWSPQKVMLVFTKWLGPIHISTVDHEAKCFQEFNTTNNTKQLFKPSKRLLRDALQYEKAFLGGKNRLAIMLRVEKVVKFYLKENHSSDPNSLKECFDAVVSLSRELENSMDGLKPLVTMDVGTFGSDSFHNGKEITNLSLKTLSNLYHKQWSTKDWEESFVEAAHGVTNEGYIAALQGTLASRADCLVLMGGGNFQALAVGSYLDYHENTKPCIHYVCGARQRSGMVPRLIKEHGIKSTA